MSKILVIDDDPDILLLVSHALKGHGYEVISTHLPAQVDAYITEHNPQLLLMDIRMPPYDGRDLCRNLKDKKVQVPVLLFSANHTDWESIAACNADGFIEKPFEISELFHMIENLLQS